jgi:hypothetical protein
VKRVTALLAALLTTLGIGLVSAPAAHADSLQNYAFDVDSVAHLTGHADITTWITIYRNSSGVVIGAVGRARITDQGGVLSAAITVKALRFTDASNTTIVRNTTQNWEALGTVGDSVDGDTNDSLNYNWSNVRNSVDGTNIRMDVVVVIHWGDDVVIQYSGISSNLIGPITCSGGFFGACGEVERALPI